MAIRLPVCRHNLEAFFVCCNSSDFLGSSCSCAGGVPPPARGCSINAYKTLYLLQYIIVFSASKAQRPGEAGGVRPGLGVGPRSGQIGSLLLKMVKSDKDLHLDAAK